MFYYNKKVAISYLVYQNTSTAATAGSLPDDPVSDALKQTLMITIDQSKCNLCGWCVEICHEYCIDIHDNVLKINYDYCSTCTQCIAVCPKEALSWENIQPGRYNREMTPDSQQIDELLKERRTIRDFKEKKIDRNLLEEIVNYAVYAPTHSFDMRAIIIDREEAIQEIDRMIYSSSLKIYKYLYKPRIDGNAPSRP